MNHGKTSVADNHRFTVTFPHEVRPWEVLGQFGMRPHLMHSYGRRPSLTEFADAR